VPYEEIASIMGITQNNVRVKMLRIREKLKTIMDNY
jgi:RNA polymerase sigma-70 factor, ECF subfamily